MNDFIKRVIAADPNDTPRLVHIDSHDCEALLAGLAALIAIAELPTAKADAAYMAKVADAEKRLRRIVGDSMAQSPIARAFLEKEHGNG
jgi:hypothetical protein